MLLRAGKPPGQKDAAGAAEARLMLSVSEPSEDLGKKRLCVGTCLLLGNVLHRPAECKTVYDSYS